MVMNLHMPGTFNVANALAAITLAHEMGVSLEIIKKVLNEFTGIWRRFEYIADLELENDANPVTIISDYGHHPDAIAETLKGARAFFPGRRLVLVYQPHQHNRTQKLFNEFADVLQEPDVLLLSDIYDVTGRVDEEERETHSSQLVEAIREGENEDRYQYSGNLEQTRSQLESIMQPGDVVIIMGAGDIDTLARAF